MKPAQVQSLVHACSDAEQARAKAADVPNETTALRLRVEALEDLVSVITEALLAGTSADPAHTKPAPPKKATKR
jgi:hypothetical protein